MAELVPVPLHLQLQHAFLEYDRTGQIFHLPKDKFFSGLPGLDTSVVVNGHRASTPLGPAAGPHTQLLQNIVLCWLGGSRIIELKTVQHLDELSIPRPCIDSANITFNVEWSQELKLETSLREYVSAAMFLEVLKASNYLGDRYPAGSDETVFDMSIGYNLEGITSSRVRKWIEGMKDATAIIDELRMTLSGRSRQFRDLPFSPRISDTITLSTFHGCPPEEIESIVTFLLKEMGLNVCVKMNPTLLGKEKVAYLLHDVLGYKEIVLADEAFDRDMKFDDAAHLVPRLESLAHAQGRQFSLKFSNTLVVRNHRHVFGDELMYMSGPALHVLALNLVEEYRERMGASVPISFSAGLTAQNMADMVAMNFVPVTTCTDLLKPGGYGRLHRYLESLGTAMRSVGATTIAEFVLRHTGQGRAAIQCTAEQLRESLRHSSANTSETAQRALEEWISGTVVPRLEDWLDHPDENLRSVCKALSSDGKYDLESMLVENAGLLNTPVIVDRATSDRRYQAENNRAIPRKRDTILSLYDCMACDKCIAVCPNAANFAYGAPTAEFEYHNYQLHNDGTFIAVSGGRFLVKDSHQVANFADLCNDCGNCETACPEKGAPNVLKPRFFGTQQSYECGAGQNGFFVEFRETSRTIYGTIEGQKYILRLENSSGLARFADDCGGYTIRADSHELLSWESVDPDSNVPDQLDLLPYLKLKFLLDAVTDLRRVNYVNLAGFQGVAN